MGVKKPKGKHFEKSVILLEHENQVKNCLKRLKEIKGQKLIIALSPFAMYELDKRGLSYKILEDYYGSAELFRVGKITHKKVERLCDIVDKILHQELPELKTTGLCPAKYHIFPLIITFDALAARVFQLKKILNRERPDAVFAFSSESYPYGIYGFCFDNRESLYGKLLSLPGWDILTKVMSISDFEDLKNKDSKIYEFEKRIYALLASEPNLFYTLDAVRHHKLKEVVFSMKKALLTKKKTNILLLNLGYDASFCYKTFLNKGIFASYLADKSYAWAQEKKFDPHALSKIIGRLNESDVRSCFRYNGIDLYPLFQERMEFLIKRGVPACIAAFEKATDVIKTKKIKAVLAPFFVTPTSHSIAQAAKNMGVPVLTWVHGPGGLSDQTTNDYLELMSSDTCMSYGPTLPKNYLHLAKEYKTKIVPVGSSRLDCIKRKANRVRSKLPDDISRKIRDNRVRLVYATTHYSQNCFFFFGFPPPSDNMLYRTQLAMIDGIGGLGDVEVTVKLFPGSHYRDPPLREYAEIKGYKNMKWVKDVPPFVDLLNHCDVVVLEFPSMPLVEAVAAGKPVFLLTKYLKILNPTLKLLKRRVACFEYEGKLIKSLKNYLQTGFYPADLLDDEFLKACCTYLNDGRSCERAVAEVLKAISQCKAI